MRLLPGAVELPGDFLTAQRVLVADRLAQHALVLTLGKQRQQRGRRGLLLVDGRYAEQCTYGCQVTGLGFTGMHPRPQRAEAFMGLAKPLLEQ